MDLEIWTLYIDITVLSANLSESARDKFWDLMGIKWNHEEHCSLDGLHVKENLIWPWWRERDRKR